MYASLTKRLLPATDLAYIDRDLSRTYPRHRQFMGHDSPGQLSLRRVLAAYAVYDPDVGYCQGMGFLAGALLIHLPEESAFWTIVALMHRGRLRELFLPALPRLQESLWILTKLIDRHMPDLGSYFRTKGLHPSMFASQWVLTLYSYCFPFDRVTRVFDAFFHDGHETEGKIVFRVALAVLRLVRPRILKLDFDEVLPLLRKVPRELGDSADDFMRRVFAERITTADIRALREQYRATEEGLSVKEASETGVRQRRAKKGDLVSLLHTPRGQAMKKKSRASPARTRIGGIGVHGGLSPVGGDIRVRAGGIGGGERRLASSAPATSTGCMATVPEEPAAAGAAPLAASCDARGGSRRGPGRASDAAGAGSAGSHVGPRLPPASSPGPGGVRSYAGRAAGAAGGHDEAPRTPGAGNGSAAASGVSATGFFPASSSSAQQGGVQVIATNDRSSSTGSGSMTGSRAGSAAARGSSSGLNTPVHGSSLPPRLPRLSATRGGADGGPGSVGPQSTEGSGRRSADGGASASVPSSGLQAEAGARGLSPRSTDGLPVGLGLEYRDGGGLQRVGSGLSGGLLRLGSVGRVTSGRRSVAGSVETSVLGGDDATTDCGSPIIRQLEFNIGSSPRLPERPAEGGAGAGERGLPHYYASSSSPGARTALSADALARGAVVGVGRPGSGGSGGGRAHPLTGLRGQDASHGGAMDVPGAGAGARAGARAGTGTGTGEGYPVPALGPMPGSLPSTVAALEAVGLEAGSSSGRREDGGRVSAASSAGAPDHRAGPDGSVTSAAALSTSSEQRRRAVAGASTGGEAGKGGAHRRSGTAPSVAFGVTSGGSSSGSGQFASSRQPWSPAGGRGGVGAGGACMGADDGRPRRSSDGPADRDRGKLGSWGRDRVTSAGPVHADALHFGARASNARTGAGAGAGAGGDSSIGTPATPASPASSMASGSASGTARLRGLTGASASVASEAGLDQGDDRLVDDDAAFDAALGQLGLVE